jgi:hypothetical protein
MPLAKHGKHNMRSSSACLLQVPWPSWVSLASLAVVVAAPDRVSTVNLGVGFSGLPDST